MKIHLILPPHTSVERYDEKIGKIAGKVPPLGLLYMAAILKKEGHSIIVSDGCLENYNQILKTIKKERPDIIGISALTFLWNRTKKLAIDIKEMLPEAFVIVGGPHPTILKEKCLEESKEIDAVIVGEGEYTILETVNSLERRYSLKNIKGLIYRQNKKIHKNKFRSPISNLDDLPFPARELINIKDYVPAPEEYKKLPMTTMISSRGCPFNCIYCYKLTGNIIRLRSPENIIKEIETLNEKYGIKEIQFHDDTFTINKERVIKFCKLLKEHKLDISWSVNSRVDTISRKLLKIMYNAGCWKIFYGGESMLQKNLNTLKKNVLVSQIKNAIKWTKESGIETEISFIFGLPGETYSDALKTIQEIKKLDPNYVVFFLLTPFPGTELYNKIEKYGTLMSNNFDDYTTHKPVFVPYSMSLRELEWLVPLAYKQFYLRPNYFFKSIIKIRSVEDIKKGLKVLKTLISL